MGQTKPPYIMESGKEGIEVEICEHARNLPSPRQAVFKDPELRHRFNASLKIIQNNGVYDAILKKHAGQ